MAPTMKLPPIRTSIQAAKQDLDEGGLTRLTGAAGADEIRAARDRLIAQAAAEDAYGCASRDDGHGDKRGLTGPNQRVWHLISKGEVFRRIALNETVHALIRHVLGPDFLLFSLSANIACRGGSAQPLHGDQIFASAQTPYPVLANCQWMLADVTEENGATRVVPRSHLARRWPRDGEAIETVPATGPAGTIMVWDGRLWHGTGVNRTPSPRYALLAAYCSPFIRQQENFSLTVPPEVLAKCSPELLGLLGFRNWQDLGMVDGSMHGEIHFRPARHTRELEPPDR
jgi:ectoine hydroxylase-related dioxygenase (phytanoyl-CoA dioxygenase family)